MRWELLGWCVVVLGCVACGESSGSKPNPATGGNGSGGNSGTAGSTNSGAGTAGNGTGTAGASGGGTGVGMCSGSSNQTPGGRIKAKYWVTSEGDRAWGGWWDTELNAACDFNWATDGKMRCIPDNWATSREYFIDDQCTQAVYTRMQTGPCESTDYIMQFLVGSCEAPGGYAFSKLGAEQAKPATMYQKFGTTCTMQVPPVESLYAKGPEVPPSMFMEATPAEYGAGPRIKSQGYATSDGTKYVSGWRDTQLGGVNCYFQPSTDGKMYCLPQGGGSVVGYADAACSTPVMDATAGCDKKLPDYALYAPDSQCGDYTYEVLKRGAAFATAPYVGTPESCTAGVLPDGSTLFQATPEPLASFQQVVDTIDETDPGRLKPRYYDGGSAGCWFHNFYDSELNQPCNFSTASDSKERCLPNGAISVLQTFSDAACTVPAALSAVDDCTPTTLPEYSTNEMPGECGRRKYQVWKVGEQVAATALPLLWRDYGAGTGGCLAYQPTATSYIKLSPVEPTAFMAGEPMIP